ncbi:MAG: hypothetical protein U0T84_09470 [Chitinophagales bacterium]
MAKTADKTSPKPSQKTKKSSNPGFFDFIKNREHLIEVGILSALYVVVLIFLKVAYPYPQTETDSGNYILSAATGKINGYRPFGYSGFLAFFHSLSGNVTFVIVWQWLFTWLSGTSFLMSLRYFFRQLPRPLFWVLALMIVFNPSLIYMDAYLMSDSLFVSLTLLFITTGMWMVYNHNYLMAVLNLWLLWECMDVRYIGLFYPAFSAAFLAMSFWPRMRFFALGLMVIPAVILFLYRSGATERMQEEFGVETFSSFGGWQKANNAVAMIPEIKKENLVADDPDVRFIHEIVKQFPDSSFSTDKIMATDFMWTKTAPGKQCLFQYIQQTNTPYMKAWTYMGMKMQDYGDWLERTHRAAYFRNFVLKNVPNVFKVFEINEYPSFAADANMKSFFTVDRDTYTYQRAWFKSLTGIRQIADTLFWLLFFGGVLGYGWLVFRQQISRSAILLAGSLIAFVLAFAAASVYAAPINNFRYMMPIYCFQVAIPVIITSLFLSSDKKVIA